MDSDTHGDSRQPDSGGGRLLLVGDDDLNRLIGETLEADGHRCDRVSTSRQARREVLEHRYEAIVLDLDSIGGAALELVQLAVRLSPATVCILRSRSMAVETVLAAMRAGLGDFLGGTLSVPQIRLRLRAAVRRSREMQQRLERILRLTANSRRLAAGRTPFPIDVDSLESLIGDQVSEDGDEGGPAEAPPRSERQRRSSGRSGRLSTPRHDLDDGAVSRVEAGGDAGEPTDGPAGPPSTRRARSEPEADADIRAGAGSDGGRGRPADPRERSPAADDRLTDAPPLGGEDRFGSFAEAAQQQLDPEGLVTASVQHLVDEFGPLNIAVYLGTGSARFGLAAYARADLPRAAIERSLARWADGLCRQAAADGSVQLFRSAAALVDLEGADGTASGGFGGSAEDRRSLNHVSTDPGAGPTGPDDGGDELPGEDGPGFEDEGGHAVRRRRRRRAHEDGPGFEVEGGHRGTGACSGEPADATAQRAAIEELELLRRHAAVVVPCKVGGVCDAVFVILAPASARLHERMRATLLDLGETFAQQLARIQRVHSRHLPWWPTEID